MKEEREGEGPGQEARQLPDMRRGRSKIYRKKQGMGMVKSSEAKCR